LNVKYETNYFNANCENKLIFCL